MSKLFSHTPPLTNLMIQALLSQPHLADSGSWGYLRQINGLKSRDLVRKIYPRSSSTGYKFRLTKQGARVKRELLTISDLTIKVVSPARAVRETRRR